MKNCTQKIKSWPKHKTFWWNLAVLIFLCWLVLARFWVLGAQTAVHYHADFALYINGEQEMLDDFSFYEEESACGEREADKPSSRAHLHDRVSSVIHVHDQAVTYGHFFANLGFSLSDDVLQTRLETYVDGDGGQLRFVLNGEFVREIANRVIGDEDVLLIDFGQDDSEILQQRHDDIPKLAAQANAEQDPESCLGQGERSSFWQRLKEALSF